MKNIKLYNVIFPFWMLMLFPQTWLIVLPGNFIIDSIVLILTLTFLKAQDKKLLYKRYILKAFLFGMLADIIGGAYMFLLVVLEVARMGDEPYLTIPALILTALLIFVFDYFFTFKKADKKTRFILSLTFAVVTAPYTFLIPTSWMY